MQALETQEAHAPTCGATTRSGEACQNQRGFRTDHFGTGRCFLHGGRSPIKHGRYSTVLRTSIAEIKAELEAEPEADQLDTLPEATMVRALAADYIERYSDIVDALVAWNENEAREALEQERRPRPQRIPELHEAAALLDTASKVVDRIHKQRNENAVSRPELLRVMAEMARVVDAHVADDSARQKIKEGWLAIRL